LPERQSGKLAKATNVKGHEGFQKTHVALAEQGVDKNLAGTFIPHRCAASGGRGVNEMAVLRYKIMHD
jgi:hypothetical protein